MGEEPVMTDAASHLIDTTSATVKAEAQGPIRAATRADVTHQKREILLLHCVLQPRQRFAVLVGLKQVRGIGRLSERLCPQTKKGFEHAIASVAL